MHFVQEDVGGVIEHIMADVPHDGARWDSGTAPTVTIKDKGGGVLVASQNATLGPTTTVGSGGAAADQKEVPATSVTGMERGDTVWLGPNSDGEWESATVEKVGSSSIGVLDDLSYTYAQGDTLKSHRMRVTLSSTDASGPYVRARAEWSYDVDSVSRVVPQVVHITPYVPRHTITASKLRHLSPSSWLRKDANQRLPFLIDYCWREYLLPDISIGYQPGAVIDASTLDAALVERVLAHLALEARDLEQHRAYLAMYQSRREAGFSISSIDTDLDGEEGRNERPLNKYSARVRRG